jgi:catechol-2,3-dioxygenase
MEGSFDEKITDEVAEAYRNQELILSYLPSIICECEHKLCIENKFITLDKKMKSIETIMLSVKNKQKAEEFYLNLGFEVMVEARLRMKKHGYIRPAQ